MTPPAHLSAGYIISKVYCQTGGNICPDGSFIPLAAIAGSFAPDIDVILLRRIKNHRKSILHAPIFWLSVCSAALAWGLGTESKQAINHASAFGLGVFFHFFLDWFAGRINGIRIFFPFSKKNYSLFPLKRHEGEIPILPSRKQLYFWKMYFLSVDNQSKFLVVSEIMLILTGFLLWLLQKI